MCRLHVEQDRMWLCKNRMPVLSSFPFHLTMQDKFTPREPFVGCTAQEICSLLGERQLTLHLSPPAAGYNSTHFEPLSRGADGGSGIRISHQNRSAGKQKTNVSGPVQVFTKEGVKSKVWHRVIGIKDEHSAIMKNMVTFLHSFIFFLLIILAQIVSFLLLSESWAHVVHGNLNSTLQSLHNSLWPKEINNKRHGLPFFPSTLPKGLCSKKANNKNNNRKWV